MTVRPTLRMVLPALVVGKVATLLAMVLALGRATGTATWAQLGQAFQHWDSLSYLDIAAHGYAARVDYHAAFLPGYPILIRAGAVVVGNPVLAGVLVSTVAELVALAAVAELVRRERDAATARFAVWVVALAPLGFFLTGVYTESAFIAGAALSLLMMRAGRARGAALAAAFACTLRLTGLALLPALVVELVRQRRPLRELAWVAVIPLPLVLYGVYMQFHAGDALAFLHAQTLPSFGESAAWPWDGLRLTWTTAATSNDPVNRWIFEREVIFGLLGLAAVAAAWVDARFPRSLAFYCTLVWLMAVSLTFWRSVPRYDLALFPVVIVVADLTVRARPVRAVVLAASAGVLVWGAWTFAGGGWIG